MELYCSVLFSFFGVQLLDQTIKEVSNKEPMRSTASVAIHRNKSGLRGKWIPALTILNVLPSHKLAFVAVLVAQCWSGKEEAPRAGEEAG